jgi:NADP-dependent 3-hydroxy acid dehydrogenase YdfG
LINGQVVAITGASSGIGRATALFLVRAGAKTVLGARREEGLSRLTEEIKTAAGQAVYRVADVSRREDLQGLVTLAKKASEGLMFCSAMLVRCQSVPSTISRSMIWETMVDVNIKGVLYGIAAALPVFRQQGSGHFIHSASTAVRKTVPNQVVYSDTKAAMLAISDGLRQELAGNIRVSTILPGFTDTAFSEHVKSPKLKEEFQKAGQKFAMSPEAVARAVAYVLEQAEDVNIGEVTLRSKAQP